ncbi:DUF2231 domain-containing protein [Gilvimarinus sp. F26214L]|uniref:DUF2231 domain-containing protein n=1 Tax=Gilvimarinus sp. DZF01 TaxID=3461371 RepID=UPI0040462803
MPVTEDQAHQIMVHPVHSVLLAGSVPLFLGALLSDIAYFSTYQIQWSSFASWLTAGGLVFAGFAILWAVVDLIRGRGMHVLIYTLLLLATWLFGFINALVHARDAWGSMPDGLILSAAVLLLACAATWAGFSVRRVGGAR